MDFEPNTVIWFCRTGIDDKNKVVCKTQDELFSCITRTGNVQGRMQKTSFQRADGLFTIRVDHKIIPYYALLQCDTVLYKNEELTAAFWIVGNILKVEWKNPDTSFVTFKIDHFMTYQGYINFNETYAYLERAHVKEDWSGSGNPMFSNMGPAEDFNVVADTPFYTYSRGFLPAQVVIMSPYDQSGKAVFSGSNKGNMYTSLQIDVVDAGTANARFNAIAQNPDASINNIVGVYGCPNEWANAIKNGGVVDSSDVELPAVNRARQNQPPGGQYRNAKCWSNPFVTIRLMSSEGDSIDFNPQWLGNDQSNYTLKTRFGGAGGLFGGAQCTFFNKNGSFNWRVWNDFTVRLSRLPACPWTGDGFTDWASVNMPHEIARAVTSSFNDAVGIFGGAVKIAGGDASGALDVAQGALSLIDRGNDLAQKTQNIKATGATVNGVGAFSSLIDVADASWGFKVVYYAVQEYTMYSVDSFFDRFGYRINRMEKIDLERRPIWCYIKTAECHVIGNPGIPYLSQLAIDSMFNSGVTMWKLDKYLSGRNIGDFSNPSENKGIQGA